MPPPAADAPPRADVDARTVFVRGLAYDASKDDLEAAFAAVGPVRSAFVVGAGAGGKHKGVGFVQFALPDDAGRAVTELDGSALKGRKIKVELAHKRASFEERKKRKRDGGDAAADGEAAAAPPAAARSAPPKPADPAKHALVRTVAVGNLTPDVVPAALAAARAAGAVVAVTHPAPAAAVDAAKLARDGCSGGVAFVEYDSVKGALAAVAKLHGASVTAAAPKGKKQGKAAAALAPATVLWARQVSGEGALLKRWRVIVRNVAYSVSEADLRSALAPAGFVWELSVPRRPDGTPRGFAFAGFTTRAAAEKAIKAVNGLELGGRVVAVDWAVGKGAFEGAKPKPDGDEPAPKEAKAEAAAGPAAEAAEPSPASDAADDDDATVDVGAERALLASVVAGLGDGDDAAADADAPPAKRGRKDGSDADAVARAAAAAAKLAAATKAAADRIAASGAAVDGTVFVRGIPPDATTGDVRARLEGFGDVTACRLVVDRATGRPKGTAFVEFADAAAAARAAAASDAADAKDGRPLTVCGADVRVALALSRDGARALAAERGGGGGGGATGDARNLHLAREGRIEPGSDAWAGLSAADRALRTRLVADAKAKLRSPNFCVSRTRLCVRNLPFSVDEAALKQLLIDAVKARATRETPKIVHVKILRGARKPGAAPTSKGAGFVEFGAHEHAVAALRALNNSPAAFGPDRRPVVEFAIDDVRALKKRTDARERALAKAKTDKEAAAKDAKAAPAPTKKRERGGKQKKEEEEDGAVAAPAGRKRKAAAADADAPKKRGKPDPKPAKPAPKPKREAKRPAAAPSTPAKPAPKPAPRKKNAAARAAARGADTRDATDDLISRYQSKLFGGEGGAGLGKWI